MYISVEVSWFYSSHHIDIKNHGTSLSELYHLLSETSAQKYLNNESLDFLLSNSAQGEKELIFSDGENDRIICKGFFLETDIF